MNVIIDSSQLQSETLRQYLSRSKSNFAVLPDFVAMEAYKGDTLAKIYKSMAILTEYPKQIVVLKGTQAICGLRGRKAGLQRRMLAANQNSDFTTYAEHLKQAQNGNRYLERQLLALGTEATAHLDKMLNDAETTGEAIHAIAQLYSKEERQIIRLGQNYPNSLVSKTVKNILDIAATVFREHPACRLTPTYSELPYTYIFGWCSALTC